MNRQPSVDPESTDRRGTFWANRYSRSTDGGDSTEIVIKLASFLLLSGFQWHRNIRLGSEHESEPEYDLQGFKT